MAVGMSIAQQILAAAGSVVAGRREAAAAVAAAPELLAPGRRRESPRRPRAGRAQHHRIRRAEREEDRDVLSREAIGAERVPGALIQPADHADVSARRPREIPVRRLRRTGRVESLEADAGLLVLWNRHAVLRRSGRRDRRARSRQGAARDSRRGAGWHDGAPLRPVPELQGRVRSSIRRASAEHCDFCGSPKLLPYEEIKAPIRPQSLLPFKVAESARPRADPAVVHEQVARAEQPPAGGRSSIASTASTFRTGRSTRRSSARGSRSGPLLLHDRNLPGQQGQRRTRQVRHTRWEPASGTVSHFFDDEPVPGTHGVSARLLHADRAVPDRRARALRHRFPVRLRRRALPGRAGRCGAARPKTR